MRRRTVIALLIGALLSALAPGLIGGSSQATQSAAPAAFGVQPIAWGRCVDADLRSAGAKCGMLVVPLDHARPSGPTIRLAVSRVRHTASPYRGVMLTNPGGPGGPGLWMATLGSRVPGSVGASYDWIGLDPRGVGESLPRLTCNPRYAGWDRPRYVPTTAAIARAWKKRAAGYADSCASSRAARLLPFMRSTDLVADFEILRQALGVEQVGFYGASYGTYLAQVYATLHPDRLSRVVMDGVIDPRFDWYESNLRQAPAFEKVVKKLFAWTARRNRTYHLGRTQAAVYRSYRRLLARVAASPGAGKVGPAEVTDAVLPAGYAVYFWPIVAQGLSRAWNQRDYDLLAAFYGGPHDDNLISVYLAVQCTDSPWPSSWTRWRRDNTALYAKAPYLTWANAWLNMSCRTWSQPAGTPVTIDGSGLTVPVLLVSETYDAATPFSGALAARREFPTSALVEGVGGTTHAAALSGVPCVDDAVRDYLADGRLPTRRSGDESDLRCRAVRFGRSATPVAWSYPRLPVMR